MSASGARKHCVACGERANSSLCWKCRQDGWVDYDEVRIEKNRRAKDAYVNACISLWKVILPCERWNTEIPRRLREMGVSVTKYWTPIEMPQKVLA